MPYISTEALVGAGLLVVLALGYQYIQPASSFGSSTSSKNKKKNKKKKSKAGGVERPEVPLRGKEDVGAKSPKPASTQPPAESRKKDDTSAPTALDTQPPKRKTLAEKIAPQPRKTKVDDMLAPEDLPAKHARVMRIVDPSSSAPPKQPVPVAATSSQTSSSTSGNGKAETIIEDDTSSEEEDSPATAKDDGWNVVVSKPKKPISLSLSASAAAAPSSAPLPVSTKIQRKNAKKAEAKKAARAAEEADRQRRLAMHRRDLERERINDIYAANKGNAGGSRGFASATVDSNGKLIWD